MLTFKEMKQENEAIGHHWFSTASMRMFRTRLIGSPIRIGLSETHVFVTSDQDSLGMAWQGERRYSVRCYSRGVVTTIGDFGAYGTKEAAQQAIDDVLRRAYEEGIASWEVESWIL